MVRKLNSERKKIPAGTSGSYSYLLQVCHITTNLHVHSNGPDQAIAWILNEKNHSASEKPAGEAAYGQLP
jgi:hypothetical protein